MLFAVTGGTGFIGTVLVRRLSKDGHRTRVLARKSSDTSRIEALPGVEIVRGDLLDIASLRTLCAGADALFHLAADLSAWRGNNANQDLVNVDGTRVVMKQAAAAGVGRVVFTSSVAALGIPERAGVPADEDNAFSRQSERFNYLWSKHRAEREAFEAMDREGLDVVAVNPSAVFGGDASGARKGGSQRIIGIVDKGVGKLRLRLYPPGGTSVCDVDSVVDGHIAAFHKGRTGERYILAGHNVTYREIFFAVAKELGVPDPKFGSPKILLKAIAGVQELRSRFTKETPQVSWDYAVLGSTKMWFDSSKAARELGYKVAPFEECVKRAVVAYKEGLA